MYLDMILSNRLFSVKLFLCKNLMERLTNYNRRLHTIHNLLLSARSGKILGQAGQHRDWLMKQEIYKDFPTLTDSAPRSTDFTPMHGKGVTHREGAPKWV